MTVQQGNVDDGNAIRNHYNCFISFQLDTSTPDGNCCCAQGLSFESSTNRGVGGLSSGSGHMTGSSCHMSKCAWARH